MDNPFIYGPALPPEQMVGRRAELRMVLGRLAKRQSTAVIGPPHVGKTTLLQALADDQMRQDLSGNRFERDVFSFVDAMTAHGFASPAEFWQRALLPLADHLSLPTPPAPRRLEMELLPLLRQSFNASDLQDICLALHINYEVLSGQGANDKTRELVILCQQQGRLEALALRMKQVHPHLDVPLPKPPPDPHLTLLQGAYLTAQHEQFGTFVLEQLFRRLHENKQRFVLLIDEFDDFLANPALHTAEFYGGLRSLASRAQGFALAIAARQELEELNRCTQAINPHGSPYFNTFTELHLGVLTGREFGDLLKLAGNRFDKEDRQFIAALSGRHPYLAQVAAAVVWDADVAGNRGDKRYTAAGEAFYRGTCQHFADTWRAMTDGMRRGITAVALTQLPNLLETRAFLTERLTVNLADYTADLERLERYGIVAQDETGWRVAQQGFLWWLADTLREQVRQETGFAAWLQAQALDGVLTNGEKQWMRKMGTAVAQALGPGVPALVEAMVKRLF
ncbi:MAG: hypothetical protein KC443_10310 [Anaerolineales bacterium]|nr:hypothetical protein [Anaerolineales bacterium]